jgi:Fic family protein
MTTKESIASMEPMLPSDGERKLEDLAFDLLTKASALSNLMPSSVKNSLGDLVRSVNSYYSSLIVGHHIHPRDIDRALVHADYSADPQKRASQHEAVAHIEVQRLIDHHQDPKVDTTSIEYITWLHRQFYRGWSEEILQIKNPDTGAPLPLMPGTLRNCGAKVDRHTPPDPEILPQFLNHFAQVYDMSRLSRIRQIIAMGAAHHRLIWIHPFSEGNRRIARLMSHASLQRYGMESSLWSVARGLAGRFSKYQELLMAANQPRRGHLDERDNLSIQTLNMFCRFFLRVCIEQVDFMTSLLEPKDLLLRMRIHIGEEVQAGRLPQGSFPILREALKIGEVSRSRISDIISHDKPKSRSVIFSLIKKGYLKFEHKSSQLTLGFPLDAVDRWFPHLYPNFVIPLRLPESEMHPDDIRSLKEALENELRA